ncbi:MAG: twin-arginine translocase TatA/TatE family subunit [Chitinophagales bacterium]
MHHHLATSIKDLGENILYPKKKILVINFHNIKMTNTLLFIGGLGTTEILLIAGVLLLMFGGKKIPELMKGLGKGINEFKKGKEGIEDELKNIK